MYPKNRGVSNSPRSSILLKAKQCGIFSIFTLTTIVANPLLVKAQIAVDGSTASEAKGNAIAPVGQGTVNGGNLYHSFDKFNVPNSGVIFNTGNSSVDGTKVNNIINRVTGNTPSSILGTIESRSAFPNANLYLLNPNGVVFGANARLDIGGSFNVTTGTSLGFDQNQKFSVDKNSLSFPSGDPKNIQFAIAQPAEIINQGNLTVDAGKNISLTAGTVINTGNLTAPNGNVNLAAVSGNSQVELRSPDLVLGFAVNKDLIPSNWNGTIATLPKLAELLTGQASQANQVVVKPDGTIALVANPSNSDIAVKDGMNITSGKIDVSSATTKGGNIGVFGNQVGLVNSLIDASGINGGGTVLIGGTFQGKGIAPNALQTYVDASSKILANGLLVGDGGRVIVWSDRSTQFLGAIAAKGGDVSGNGGFVEVSGKQNLDYRGSTNALAPHGKIGTLLLDPTNITIINSVGNASLTDVSAFANTPSAALLSNLTINAATANVFLQATNDIYFNANINIAVAGVGLTAQAGNSIAVNSSITTNGNVSLTANDNTALSATNLGNITISAPITTNGGAIAAQINNAGGLTINSNLLSGGGNINLSVNSGSTAVSGIFISSSSIVDALGGSVTITGTSNNTLNTDTNGVWIQGTIQTSGNGSVIIDGTSGTGASNERGVLIDQTGAKITAVDGNISITGTGRGASFDNEGIQLRRGVIISATGTGNIFLTGTGNNNNTSGILIFDQPIPTLSTLTGNITLTGITSANSTGTKGINIDLRGISGITPVINSTNGGSIFLIGTSETDISLLNVILGSNNTNSVTFTPNSSSKLINLSGTVSSSAMQNYNGNVGLFDNTILNSGTGNINFNGNVTGNQSLTLNAGSGNVTLGAVGTSTTPLVNVLVSSANTATFNGAVVAQTVNSSAVSTVFNNVDITGTIGIGLGNFTINGNVSFTGNEVELNGLASGNGNLTIAPFLPSLAIALGGFDTGALDLTALDLSAFSSGTLSSITIGNATTQSNISLTGNVSFAQATTIQSPAGNGTINTSGFDLANTGGSLILLANQNITTGNITAAGNAIAITSTSGAIDTSLGTISTGVSNGTGGNITYQSTGNITTGSISSSANSNQNSGNGGGVSLSAGGDIIITGNIWSFSNNGNGGLISLITSGGSINTGNVNASSAINGTGGNITYQSTGNITTGTIASFAKSNQNSGKGGDISLSAGGDIITTGNIWSFAYNGNGGLISLITFGGSINTGNVDASSFINGTSGNITYQSTGNITTGSIASFANNGNGGNIIANSTGTTRFGNSLNAASLTTNVGGTTELNGNITTTGSQTYNDAVNLIGTVQLNTTNNVIAFNNTINGTQDLTLNSGTGNLTFNSAIGNSSTLGNITANSSGITRFNSTVNAANLTTDTGGTTELNANVITSGAQTYNDAINLTNAVQLNTTNNAIAFNNTVNGNQSLSLNAGTSSIFFNGIVGGITPLASLAASTLTSLNNLEINTVGNIATGNIANQGRNIAITSNLGAIDTSAGTISTAISSGNAGNVTIQAKGNINLTPSGTAAIDAFAGGTGNGGNVSITSSNGTVTTGLIDTTAKVGNAGNVIIQAKGDINNSPTGSAIDAVAFQTGNSGNVSITSSNGNVAIGTINAFNPLSSSGNAGNITIQALGDISVTDGGGGGFAIGAFSNNTTGNGGNVSITSSNGNVTTGTIDTTANTGTIGNAGNVTIQSFGGISIATIGASSNTTGDGGNVSITSSKGNVTTGIIDTTANSGNGGNVTIQSFGSFGDISKLSGIKTYAINAGNSGSVSITSSNGNVATGTIGTLNTVPSSGNAGNVTIQAFGDIDITDSNGAGFAIGAFNNNTRNGGIVSITSSNGNVTNGIINTTTSSGNAGNVTIQSLGNISNTTIQSYSSSNGNGGIVSITSSNGNVTNGEIDTTASSGNAGNVTIKSLGDIKTTGNFRLGTFTIGNGGNVSLTSTNGEIDVSSSRIISASSSGTSGSIALNAFGNITTGAGTTSGTGTPNSITFTSTNDSINTSLGDIDAGGGNITLIAKNNITTSGVFSRAANGGAIALTSQSGAINTSAGTLDTSSTTTSGNGGNITFSSIGTTIGNLNTSSVNGNAGAIAFSNSNITIAGTSINTSSINGTAANLTFGFPLTLNTSNLTINTSSGVTSGNVTFASNLNGTSVGANNLTINSGTGNITFFGAVGGTTPLTSLTTTGNTTLTSNVTTSGTQIYNSGVTLAGDVTAKTTDSAIAFNNTVNGNQALSVNGGTNSIFFNGIVGGITPLASLAIASTSTLTSLNNLEINTVGNITTGSITNLGRNIAIISNNGNIDTSAGVIDTNSSTGNGGNVLLRTLGNITVNSVNTESLLSGGDISLISLGGSINTSAGSTIGFLNSRSNNGIGGDILLQAAGNIVTGDLSTSSGQGSGKISLITSNGSIDTSLGLVQTEIGLGNGNGGEILYRATGNITTGEVFSRIQSTPSTGSGGKISFVTTGGSINTQRAVYSLSYGTNGGDILYEATGDIKTSSSGVIASGNLNGGNITFKTTDGAIDTSLGQVISSGDNGGTAGNILFQAAGNITTQDLLASGILGNAGNITLQTTGNVAIAGNVDTGATNGNAGNIAIAATGIASDLNINSLNSRSLGISGNGGDIQIQGTRNITTGDLLSTSNNGNAGKISLSSTSGSINISLGFLDSSSSLQNDGIVSINAANGNVLTGSLNSSTTSNNANSIAGDITIVAKNQINAGLINASANAGKGGNVLLDPIGDVVVAAIDASSSTQGGNVTIVSTDGNLRITDTILSSINSSCIGASICTSGGTGGNITLQTGGLNPFIVGDATTNGSSGTLTTGLSTLDLGTSIPVILSSSFTQEGIKITPGGVISPTDSEQPFVPPETTTDRVSSDSKDSKVSSDSKLPPPPEFMKQEAAGYLQSGNLVKAFDVLERSYGSELETFVGHSLNLSSTTLDDSQDILAKVAKKTEDVAALVYPILLGNRIEIMVVPPKDKGAPFRKFTIVPSQEFVETVLTDYRNNIRDVGSNDYLEQSQKLYDWIMRPIDAQLKAMKINTLVFVMDGGFRVMPPAAMHDGKQFLVERYGIASVASMRVTRIEERDRKSTRVLAMGLTDSVSGFNALPSVDVEIKTIASNVLEGTSFLNKDFTVDNLQTQRQLGKYSILHLGTHGKFVSGNIGESFIQFWDSRLSLSQIPKLRFDKPAIDMLTLSACQTAVGNNLGISGLAVESGAKSVLASLWEVSDAGTAPLMISFYKSFPHAINKAQAMQQAQVSLLSGKVNIKNGEITGILGLPNIKLPTGAGEIDLSHPFYWSSFILVGNWL